MKFNTFFYLIILLLSLSCKTQNDCNVREISNNEVFRNALNGDFVPLNTPYYLPTGEIVPLDSLFLYPRDKYTASQFVNCNNKVVKLIIRPIKDDDIILRNRIDSLYGSNIDLTIKRIKFIEPDTNIQNEMIELARFNSPIKIFDIDCNVIKNLIDNTFIKDQENRNKLDLNIDRENSRLIESIVEKCGFDEIIKTGKDAVYKTFMIVQHGPKDLRKKYIEYFKKLNELGLLDSNVLALMIDRILTEEGKEQLYGTQFRINKITGEIVFYPILDPDNLDFRRKEMNLEKFEYYHNSIQNK